MKIEDIFKEAEGPLTLEQFNEIVSSKGAKFADLSEGNYLSVGKHEGLMESLEKQIETLTEAVAQREADVNELTQRLQEAGNDAEALANVSEQLAALQERYNEDAEAYEEQLSRQAREFAVKEYAATKEFTSEAAKQFYIEKLIDSEDVDFNRKGELEGMEDFDSRFAESYKNTFYEKAPEVEPPVAPEPEAPKPKFSNPTPGATNPAPKMSLSEMMQAKNENPDMSVGF
jgi:chromosome segregation ATPase